MAKEETRTLVEGGHAFVVLKDGTIYGDADTHDYVECARCGILGCSMCHPKFLEEKCTAVDIELPGLEFA